MQKTLASVRKEYQRFWYRFKEFLKNLNRLVENSKIKQLIKSQKIKISLELRKKILTIFDEYYGKRCKPNDG